MMLNLSNLIAVVPCPSAKTPIRQAIEDTTVIFVATMISALMVIGYPPSLETLYIPFLSSALVGVTAYAKARSIPINGTKTEDVIATPSVVEPKE